MRQLTGQLTDKPTRGQSSHGVVNLWTSKSNFVYITELLHCEPKTLHLLILQQLKQVDSQFGDSLQNVT